MRIIIKDTDRQRPIKLLFPTGLVFNRLTACLAPLVLKDSDITITRKQAIRFIRELKRCKKRQRGWKIVEVHSADGEHIEITL